MIIPTNGVVDGLAIRIGVDGYAAATVLEEDECCPPDICGVTACSLACSFISLLPSGPLWDQKKAEFFDHYSNNGQNPCEPACPPPDLECQSLVAHAAYKGLLLFDYIRDSLYPAYREANPFTAVSTLDTWLDRLGWEDCFLANCTGNGFPLHWSTLQEGCEVFFCDTNVGDELECAVKQGIVRALSRLNMGVVKNLQSINWVIEPLGAQVSPFYETTADDAEACVDVEFEICNVGTTLPACNLDPCDPVASRTVNSFFLPDCTHAAGLPAAVFPGVLAAECIVRSMMTHAKTNIIRRCDCDYDTLAALA